LSNIKLYGNSFQTFGRIAPAAMPTITANITNAVSRVSSTTALKRTIDNAPTNPQRALKKCASQERVDEKPTMHPAIKRKTRGLGNESGNPAIPVAAMDTNRNRIWMDGVLRRDMLYKSFLSIHSLFLAVCI